MNEKTVPLCCCEYFDGSDERNHILACCCNCVELDEAFERFVTCRSISRRHKEGIIKTMQDRLRIPWQGGAKQLAFDALLPVFILPIMLLTASISLWWTIFSFTTVAIFLTFIFNFLIKTIPNTKFFFVWTLTSLILLYIIFEFVVIPFLEILVEENIALSIFIFGFVICLYLVKVRTKNLGLIAESEAESGYIEKTNIRTQSCSICQIKVPDKDHHCIWFDCCIGRHNRCLFMMALFFAICALLYSSNLTLTSVCHPFTLYKTILLPDDCSDVYKLFELGLSFVAAIYSIILAVLISILFLQQVLLISLGITLREWTNLSLSSKLCLGMCSKRPNSQGFIKNWSTVICWRNNGYTVLTHT